MKKTRANGRKKGKITGSLGIISGSGSIISAHNVCHAICLGVVAMLSVFGIALSSTALMFIQDYNMLFWTMGIFFLLVSLILYARFGKCISRRMIIFNAGLIVAGVPFVSDLQLTFWIIGFSVALLVFFDYAAQRLTEVKLWTIR